MLRRPSVVSSVDTLDAAAQMHQRLCAIDGLHSEDEWGSSMRHLTVDAGLTVLWRDESCKSQVL